MAGACASLGGSRPAMAQSALSPDTVLQQLMDGNQRFVAKQLTSFDEDLRELKENTAEKQEPFAAVLSCVDSRVPVELVFDQSIGHLFVARVAGNIASPEVIASLEYGVAVLQTKVVMVMGHGNCGAVQAAIAAKAVPGQISALYSYLRPAVDQAGANLDAAIKANAWIQARLLAEASPVLAAAIERGVLKVVASHYELASGTVTLLR
jgi:carbonic anhydrase